MMMNWSIRVHCAPYKLRRVSKEGQFIPSPAECGVKSCNGDRANEDGAILLFRLSAIASGVAGVLAEMLSVTKTEQDSSRIHPRHGSMEGCHRRSKWSGWNAGNSQGVWGSSAICFQRVWLPTSIH